MQLIHRFKECIICGNREKLCHKCDQKDGWAFPDKYFDISHIKDYWRKKYMILNKRQIRTRIEQEPEMVGNIKNLNIQLQTDALDLTVKKIFELTTSGELDFDNTHRDLSKKREINRAKSGESEIYVLKAGAYQIEVNETFHMPLDVAGITISRSSLQRCGASIETGFFDAGFVGDGYSLLVVYNPHGLVLHKDARISQMEFHFVEETDGYNGIYKNPTKL